MIEFEEQKTKLLETLYNVFSNKYNFQRKVEFHTLDLANHIVEKTQINNT